MQTIYTKYATYYTLYIKFLDINALITPAVISATKSWSICGWWGDSPETEGLEPRWLLRGEFHVELAGGDSRCALSMGPAGFNEPAYVEDEERLPDSLLKTAGLLSFLYLLGF